RAAVEDYDVVWPSAAESFEQRLLRRLLRTGQDLGLDLATGGLVTGPLAALVGEVQRSTAGLLHWNDPRHLYLHCLCETP
ncbi:MAG: signal peptide peptidase SppA, partial [Thauera sp.]